MITETDLNVLKYMASKICDWNWKNLDRGLAINNIPGFSYVVDIINRLSDEGLVNIEDSGHPSMPRYRVSEKGFKLLENLNTEKNQ
ncbi:MarR family transcriptional regulator [Citrobacter sedlakii]|uniref:MarR family transcriptional regulator n=1 Tax=Citrobacter sedlakii TaxID=67826 RepID=UPI0022B39974|nr:MarR family transcriptional regulator [Citrobacter sedlakii]MCZ4675519.1 MarR family transcriptional regulator [Citrobacter sedlakii]MDR5005574.1 MarR family transcriptional regulator [Citrobacter sedlakii]